jgi:hypothetical protein
MQRRSSTGLMALALVAAASSALSAQQRGNSRNYIYFEPVGTTCNGTVVVDAVKKVKIKADEYTTGMI